MRRNLARNKHTSPFGALALAVLGGCSGVAGGPATAPGDVVGDRATGSTGAPTAPREAVASAQPLAQPLTATRGVDPSTIHAPQYIVSMAVETDSTANPSSQVYRTTSAPSQTTYAPADQVRAGLEGVIERNGSLVLAAPPVTCQIGAWRPAGDIGDPANGNLLLWTSPGGVYTTCMENPYQPDVVGKPLALGAPVTLDMGENLDLYARLEVLGAGYLWSSGSDPNAGVSGTLQGLGGAFQAMGNLLPETPVGTAATAIGTVLSLAGQFTSGSAQPPAPVCMVTNTLIPAFGPNDAPSDAGSPLLRMQINGRQLYEATARGDAGVTYELDWRPMPTTSMCQQHRPHTKVTFRFRRVQMMGGPPGAQQLSTSGPLSGDEPDQAESFSVDGKANIIHHLRGANAGQPLAWQTLSDVPSTVERLVCTGFIPHLHCLPGTVPLFAPNTKITALSRTPGHLDLFAISPSGDIMTNWRDKWADNNAWHTWFAITSGGKFPAGAPLAATSRFAGHIDVFAVANDGSVVTVWWDQGTNSWQPSFAISQTGKVKPWNGSNGGGIAAAASSIDAIDVIVADNSGYLADVNWNSATSSWAYRPVPLQAPSGANVAIVSRDATTIDIFAVDPSGLLKTTTSFGINDWSVPEVVLPASYALAAGAPLAVVPRKVNAIGDWIADNVHMDLFVVGGSGHVIHVPWRYGDDNYMWSPSRAESLAATAPAGSEIGAWAPYAGTIQVAARKADGTMVHTWYEDVESNVINWQLADQ